jgi:hypothetical protein
MSWGTPGFRCGGTKGSLRASDLGSFTSDFDFAAPLDAYAEHGKPNFRPFWRKINLGCSDGSLLSFEEFSRRSGAR